MDRKIPDSSEMKDTPDSSEKDNLVASFFLSNVTHELRTPLNGIQGMTHLCMETCTDPELQEYLKILNQSVEGLTRFVNTLIDYTNITNSTFVFKPEVVNLEVFLLDIIRQFLPGTDKKHISVNLFLSPVLPSEYIFDPQPVRQMLEQLIGNAVKFTEQGSITLKIFYQKNQLEFVLQDTGVGMSRDFIHRATLPFVQEDSSYSRTYGGSGIGLTIVDRIVSSMKGELIIQSIQTIGTTVKVILPNIQSKNKNRELPINNYGFDTIFIIGEGEVSDYLYSFFEDLKFHPIQIHEMIEFQRFEQVPSKSFSILCPQHNLNLNDINTLLGNDRTKVIQFSSRGYFQQKDFRNDVECIRQPFGPDELILLLSQVLPKKQQPGEPGLPSLDTIKILLVEDDVINSLSTTRNLQNLGSVVFTAKNVKSAIDILNKEKVDVGLIDIGLPEISGFELARNIRNREIKNCNPDLPLIAFTAYSNDEDQLRMRKTGFNDVVIKPYRMDNLTKKILKSISNESPNWIESKESFLEEAEKYASNLDYEKLEEVLLFGQNSLFIPQDDYPQIQGILFKLLLSVRREDISGINLGFERLKSYFLRRD